MAEKLDAILEEFTLTLLGVEFIVTQQCQHLAYVFLVFIHIATVDENVIEEHQHELVQEGLEDRVHQMHERCRCIRQAER